MIFFANNDECGEILNLARFDGVRINTSPHGVHHLEAFRHIDGRIGDDGFALQEQVHICFAKDEDEAWAKREELVAQLKAAGVVVVGPGSGAE